MKTADIDHYSGLLVITLPGRHGACMQALRAHAGVTVSIEDPDRHRAIIVLEATSQRHLEDLHLHVRSHPDVVTADPVIHYVDDRSRDPNPHS